MNISSWLQSLARLTGSLCRRYADMGVTPICAALASTLRTGDCFELLVLQQLVAHMAVGGKLDVLRCAATCPDVHMLDCFWILQPSGLWTTPAMVVM